jgi:hypothetical protein
MMKGGHFGQKIRTLALVLALQAIIVHREPVNNAISTAGAVPYE